MHLKMDYMKILKDHICSILASFHGFSVKLTSVLSLCLLDITESIMSAALTFRQKNIL